MPLARFERLGPMLASPEGEVRVELSFEFDSEKRRIITGRVSAVVRVECQRCLQAMTADLESGFSLGVVDTEAMARQLPSEYEPVIQTEPELDLLALVEDELIMAVPDFPLHDEVDCPAAEVLADINANADAAVAEEAQATDNPFSVLAGIKGKPSEER